MTQPELTREQIEEERDAAQSLLDASPEAPGIVRERLQFRVSLCSMALAHLRRQQAGSAWILVSERKPEQHTRVLISIMDANTSDGWAFLQCAFFDGCGNFWADDRQIGAAPAKPTHWMPLPSPPAGEGNRENQTQLQLRKDAESRLAALEAALREPTAEMVSAANRADLDYSNNRFCGDGGLSRIEFIYKAMTAVALSALPDAGKEETPK